MKKICFFVLSCLLCVPMAAQAVVGASCENNDESEANCLKFSSNGNLCYWDTADGGKCKVCSGIGAWWQGESPYLKLHENSDIKDFNELVIARYTESLGENFTSSGQPLCPIKISCPDGYALSIVQNTGCNGTTNTQMCDYFISCRRCADGTYGESVSKVCYMVSDTNPVGNVSTSYFCDTISEAEEQCLDCPSGYYCRAGKKKICPVGTTITESKSNCCMTSATQFKDNSGGDGFKWSPAGTNLICLYKEKVSG